MGKNHNKARSSYIFEEAEEKNTTKPMPNKPNTEWFYKTKQKYKGMHTFQLGWRSTNGGGSLKLINVSASGTQPWDTAWKIFPLRDGMLDKVSY